MDEIRKIISSGRILAQFFRYGLASILTYGFIFGGLYLLTNAFGLKANISYFIVVSLSYVALYWVGAGLIFDSKKTASNARRFLWHIFIFWFMNNLIFNILLANTNIHYILIAAINIAIFAPLRFLSLRYFVFQAHKEG